MPPARQALHRLRGVVRLRGGHGAPGSASSASSSHQLRGPTGGTSVPLEFKVLSDALVECRREDLVCVQDVGHGDAERHGDEEPVGA